MELNKYTDFGIAFEKLKVALNESEAIVKDTNLNPLEKYPKAYGKLSGTLEVVLFMSSNLEKIDDLYTEKP